MPIIYTFIRNFESKVGEDVSETLVYQGRFMKYQDLLKTHPQYIVLSDDRYLNVLSGANQVVLMTAQLEGVRKRTVILSTSNFETTAKYSGYGKGWRFENYHGSSFVWKHPFFGTEIKLYDEHGNKIAEYEANEKVSRLEGYLTLYQEVDYPLLLLIMSTCKLDRMIKDEKDLKEKSEARKWYGGMAGDLDV
ncbi:hypothetical protein GGI12_002056 [Dipsacomyces acuminosporus]|nr:hypothetical protein GGI12_002056 [Dipsacomyces acuminosporus]